MKLARLNEEGIRRFGRYLAELKAQSRLEPPRYLLADVSVSEDMQPTIDVGERIFTTRLEAAAYLDSLLRASGNVNAERDVGLWSWLTLLYFDQLCPERKDGSRTVGEQARYIPQIDVSRRYYRHMLLGPLTMYRVHADNPQRLLGLLSSPMSVATSETYRLFIENPALIACNAVVEVATWLYYDQERCRLKRGTGSKDAGGCRRLIDFLQQIDCTFDLPILTRERLGAMLPKEFDQFVPQ